jgi:hypothetical protein
MIDRSLVKHATVTTPYCVTRGTIYKELLEEGREVPLTESVSSRRRGCVNVEEPQRFLRRLLQATCGNHQETGILPLLWVEKNVRYRGASG